MTEQCGSVHPIELLFRDERKALPSDKAVTKMKLLHPTHDYSNEKLTLAIMTTKKSLGLILQLWI
jgi:hypothetical protein